MERRGVLPGDSFQRHPAVKIELQDIHKHYGALRANDGVSLTVAPGSIHGILGENGAGKSTLMKILAGFIRPSAGSLRIDEREVVFHAPSQAVAAGIGMLYQEPLDFGALTVLENFSLGLGGGPSRRGALRRQLEQLCGQFGFHLPPRAQVAALSVGERQQLEILRLLALGIRALILDEPTTGITGLQRDQLFGALRRMAAEGRAVLLVSHKLAEVEALCDRVTVLRQGRVSGALQRPFDTETLLRMMFGAPPPAATRSGVLPGEELLALHAVSARGGRAGLHGCSLQVRCGETVGLAGLEGSGQSLLLRVGAGLTRPWAGSLRLAGHDVTGQDHLALRRQGVAFLPTDRLREGLIAGLTIREHVALLASGGVLLDPAADRRAAASRIGRLRIAGQPDTRVEMLSGGNQQRLLLSFLPGVPRLLLLENPTRGLDLDSTRWVWQQLHAFCHSGSAIVFASSELEEILAVADRVAVFFEGRIVMQASTAECDSEQLGRALAGHVSRPPAGPGH
jgi:simple sugar transport system ATP-binding protein